MLKGRFISKIDEWGRIRIPKALHRIIEVKYGNEVFVTTVNRRNVLIYPLSEWEKVEEKIMENSPKNPVLVKFVEFTSYFGKLTKIDKRGRVLIHSLLRKEINLKGRIVIEGMERYLKISAYSRS